MARRIPKIGRPVDDNEDSAVAYLSGEGHHMVFTHAEDINVTYDEEFVSVNTENSIVYDLIWSFRVSFGEEQNCFSISVRCLQETLAVRILADL
jgi:hypothetical protein